MVISGLTTARLPILAGYNLMMITSDFTLFKHHISSLLHKSPKHLQELLRKITSLSLSWVM